MCGMRGEMPGCGRRGEYHRTVRHGVARQRRHNRCVWRNRPQTVPPCLYTTADKNIPLGHTGIRETSMRAAKRKALEAAGWRFGDALDFLAMTEEAPGRRDVLTMPED